MFKRGGAPEALVLRELTADDIPALARVHVRTFNETHVRFFGRGPTDELRLSQWREKYAKRRDGWTCFVLTRADGEFVGFVNGEPSDGEYAGHLEKIYLLRAFHRRGLGERLFRAMADHFVRRDIASMSLFSQANNPSCGFFEKMGGERLRNDRGGFDGGYGWRDLRRVLER